MGGINLNDILAALESRQTPEEMFEEKLAASCAKEDEKCDPAEEKKETPTTKKKEVKKGMEVDAACATKKAEYDEELEKQAAMEKVAELDAQGRIMARSFVDELYKIAAYLEENNQ